MTLFTSVQTQCIGILQKILFSSVWSDRHNIHEEYMCHHNYFNTIQADVHNI